jgi:hypothetical protein
MTSWYALREIESTWRANQAYVWIVIGLPRSGSSPFSLGRQVARELLNEQPAVREDEDPHRPSRLDEPRGCDRLARGRRMAEAEAPHSARVFLRREHAEVTVVRALVEVRFLLVLLGRDGGVAVPVAVLGLVFVSRDELCEHPGERVDLMAAELGAGGEPRGMVVQHPLEAEHEGVTDLPFGRGRSAAGLHLGERVVERASARSAFGQRLCPLLGVQERLACPGFRSAGGGYQAVRLYRSNGRVLCRFLHGSSARALPENEDACARSGRTGLFQLYRSGTLLGRYGTSVSLTALCCPTAFFMYSYASSLRPAASARSASFE